MLTSTFDRCWKERIQIGDRPATTTILSGLKRSDSDGLSWYAGTEFATINYVYRPNETKRNKFERILTPYFNIPLILTLLQTAVELDVSSLAVRNKNNTLTFHCCMFKFIHAADIHLDSPLRGLSNYERAPVDQIRGAARKALQNLVTLASQQSVDFVVIAGDVYDGDWQDYSTGLFFVGEMAKLNDLGIPVYLISGNHDAANNMTRSLRLPENVQVFPHDAPHTETIEELRVALHGQSFAQRAVHANLANAYPPALSGYFNVGILHTSATGREGHEPYAPCSIEELKLKGYDYWALGHVHNREELAPGSNIWFSGNIQGRHVRECGPKGVNLVTVADSRVKQVEFCPLDILRWEVEIIDIGELEDFYDVIDAVRDRLSQLLNNSDGRTLAVRVVLTGTSNLHDELNARYGALVAEIQGCSLQFGSVWIEKVKVKTTSVSATLPRERISDEVLSVLHEVFDGYESTDGLIKELMQDCLKRFPGGLAERLELNDPEWIRSAIAEARSKLIQELNA